MARRSTRSVPLKELKLGKPQSVLTDTQWLSVADRLSLSRREFQIAQGIFLGEKETLIARGLGISAHTVHSHVKRLYRKLGVRDHGELLICIFRTHLAIQAVETAADSRESRNVR